MLAIVVTQLLDNAWKFTRDRADAVIRVSAGEVDGLPGICVADNGAGFDMAHAEQLFPPFQRLHRQDEFPGIGIGLATVQRIIHRHGGSIWAEGKPNEGATFYFTLEH
jgi:light-regulated signal transduction histidine kinase (bacteriophytochrome)